MRAVFSNQVVVIESEVQSDGSGILMLTSAVNDPNYMASLLNAVQEWQPRGGKDLIGTDARIENNQVICSLIPQNGGIDTEHLNTAILPGLRIHLEQGTNRAMGASASVGVTTGEEDYQEIRGT